MKVLDYSSADQAGNVRLHTLTNRTLLKAVMSNSAGDCIHITGRMNALADPFHRRMCAEVARSGKGRFVVVYDAPSIRDGAENLALHSAARWTRATWDDKLAAMRLIGEEFVDVLAAPTKDAVQYTVFGNKFVQLQGMHSDAAGAPNDGKPIWLIQHEEVNGFLTEKAKNTVDQSRDIPEAVFRNLFVRMNGVAAHNIIKALSSAGAATREGLLTKRFLDFDPAADEILDGLTELGLVALNLSGSYAMTSQGHHFATIRG
jgi:hypothetical protein